MNRLRDRLDIPPSPAYRPGLAAAAGRGVKEQVTSEGAPVVSVSIQNVTKRFNDVVAADNVTLEIQTGELFFLLGPSGCGKTTLLRILAGFCEVDSGRVLFNDRDVTGAPAHKRNTGMVFQNYALWPHMTVEGNVAYGLEIRKVPSEERRGRVAEALAMVQMQGYGARRPSQLSGGQQQRVALARALVVKPDVVLLDEPLSNLDAGLRLDMRDEIRRIHLETGITTIYVTHDQKEALSLAQRMAVLRQGRVEQVGKPREVYERPCSSFVASFIGRTNLIEGEIAGSPRPGLWEARTAHGVIRACDETQRRVGEKVLCSIRPESIRVGAPEPGDNSLPARLLHVTYLGEQEHLHFELAPGGAPILAMRLSAKAAPDRPDNISFAPSSVRLLSE